MPGYYGNILTLYHCSDSDTARVSAVLGHNHARYEQLENTFFIESDENNTHNIVNDIRELEITFTFYHNNIADGSDLVAAGIDNDIVDHIKNLLL